MSDKLVEATPEVREETAALIAKLRSLVSGEDGNVVLMALVNVAVEVELFTGVSSRDTWLHFCAAVFDHQYAVRIAKQGPPS